MGPRLDEPPRALLALLYKLFYQVDVDAATIRGFLANSYPPYRA